MSRPNQAARDAKNRERGFRQERRIIGQLLDQPMTVRQLAEALHMCDDSIRKYLKRFLTSTPRRAYICGFHELGPGIKPAPLYALGNKPDAKASKKPYQPKAKVDLAAWRRDQIVKELMQPMTVHELSEKIRLCLARTYEYLAQLRDPENQRVHVTTWKPSPIKGDLIAVYIAGKGKDVPKPKRTRRDHHERMMADPERAARYRAKRYAEWIQRSSRKKPATIFSALGKF